MKNIKKIFTVMAILAFAGCANVNPAARLETLTYDGCEYVMCQWGNGVIFSHKGNCKACREWMSNLQSNQNSTITFTPYAQPLPYLEQAPLPFNIPTNFDENTKWMVTNSYCNGMSVFMATGVRKD